MDNSTIKPDVELIKAMIPSPIFFIYKMWGIVPQPLKAEYQDRANGPLEDFQPQWFEPFVKGKHLTWQQW